MAYLIEIYPRFVAFPQLYETSVKRLGYAVADVANHPEYGQLTLASELLVVFAGGLLAICVHPPICVNSPTQRSLVTPLARLQAERGQLITTQRHQAIRLGGLERRIVRRLDGSHARDELIQCVAEAAESGDLTFKQGEKPLLALGAPQLQKVLDGALSMISAAGLLIG